MGGMVAQQFAAKYPDRVQRLVINCSAAKLDYAGVLTFRGWIDIAERLGVGSRRASPPNSRRYSAQARSG
jgi:pimeloyl-ACP methyl ester carboxylesterase